MIDKKKDNTLPDITDDCAGVIGVNCLMAMTRIVATARKSRHVGFGMDVQVISNRLVALSNELLEAQKLGGGNQTIN